MKKSKKFASNGYAPNKACDHCKKQAIYVGLIEIINERGESVEYIHLCTLCLLKIVSQTMEKISEVVENKS